MVHGVEKKHGESVCKKAAMCPSARGLHSVGDGSESGEDGEHSAGKNATVLQPRRDEQSVAEVSETQSCLGDTPVWVGSRPDSDAAVAPSGSWKCVVS